MCTEENPLKLLLDTIQRIGENYNRLVQLNNMNQGKILALTVTQLLVLKNQRRFQGLVDLREELQGLLRVCEDPDSADLLWEGQPVFGVIGDVLFPDDTQEMRDQARSGLILETRATLTLLDKIIERGI